MASSALMAFAITITIFSGDTDKIRVTHNDVLSPAACAEWQKASGRHKHGTVDPSGRLVQSVSYECVPIRPEELTQKLTRAMATR